MRYRDKVGSNAALFAAFVVHPVAYAVWLAVKPSLFIEMVEDPLYLAAIVNPLFFMGVGVRSQLFAAALLLSGFLRLWWIRLLLVPFLPPG